MAMNPRLLRPKASGKELPQTIAGLELWLDFNDSTKVTLSGSSISEIKDKSGNGWAATQSTGANQPTLTTSAINGRSAASFDGTNDRFTIASFPAITDCTAFAVCYRDWQTAAFRCIASSASYGATAGHVFFLETANNFNDWVAADMVSVGDGYSAGRSPSAIGPRGTVTNNTPLILSAVLSSALSGMWKNGTDIATRVKRTGAGTSASGTFYIGSAPSADYWNGAIAELLIYRSSLTSTQIKSVESWLGTRYNITVA